MHSRKGFASVRVGVGGVGGGGVSDGCSLTTTVLPGLRPYFERGHWLL